MMRLAPPTKIGSILVALALSLSFALEVAAVVGAPATPVSYAGVARRTTRRAVVATSSAAKASSAATSSAAASASAAAAQASAAAAQASAASAGASAASAKAAAPAPPPPAAGTLAIGTVVTQLPSGCVSAPVSGTQYYLCAGTYYRPAFQGTNLVYVVQEP
jgi:hypothetical protein